MASSDDSASKDKGKGAAEEPEPERSNTSSSAATASYDPSDYQKPHPDDRSGGDGKKGGATKPRGKAKAAPTDKAKDTSGKGEDDGSHRCANCDKPGATKKCGRCGVEWYCDRNCQKVRVAWWAGSGYGGAARGRRDAAFRLPYRRVANRSHFTQITAWKA